MKKLILVVYLIFNFSVSIYSQCSGAYITATYQAGGQVDFTITGYTPPPGWDVSFDVDFGDNSTGTFSGATVSHTYAANVTYYASFYIHYYWTLDTSVYCNVFDDI